MFVPLKKTLLISLKKKGISEKLEKLSHKETAERVVREVTKQANIRIRSISKGTLFVKAPSALAASEVRLKERRILRSLAEEQIPVQKIKCAP